MFGNRKEICNQLNKMFIGDEPLAVLFWTEASIAEACWQLDPTPSEVIAVMEAIGNMPYEQYQAEGIDLKRFPELLRAYRETTKQQVEVSEAVLKVLIRHAARDLTLQAEQARMDGMATPASVTRTEYQIDELKALMGMADATDDNEE